MGSRWNEDPGRPRGRHYDQQFADLARQGVDVHGEAHLVEALLSSYRPEVTAPSVLDAGCGTGRVAIELHRRGMQTVGVDLDPEMLAAAQANAPELEWVEADLNTFELGRSFDAAVLAGNVLLFVESGREASVVARVSAHLAPGGLFICGFQVRAGGYGPADVDRDATAAGLRFVARWSTWDRKAWPRDGGYQVSLHRAPAAP